MVSSASGIGVSSVTKRSSESAERNEFGFFVYNAFPGTHDDLSFGETYIPKAGQLSESTNPNLWATNLRNRIRRRRIKSRPSPTSPIIRSSRPRQPSRSPIRRIRRERQNIARTGTLRRRVFKNQDKPPKYRPRRWIGAVFWRSLSLRVPAPLCLCGKMDSPPL